MGRYCAVSGMRKCSAVPIFLLRRASAMSNFDCIYNMTGNSKNVFKAI